MSFSKEAKHDTLDIKVHYQYHGIERCGLIDTTFNSMYGMDYDSFITFLKDEIPQLNRLDTVRICFQDEEKTYIDMTPKNYHRFLRLSTHSFQSDVPKINIKVLEGASPAIAKTGNIERPSGHSSRALFDPEEYKQTYKSPLELEMDLKKREISEKEKESTLLNKQYEKMSREFNPTVYQDTSKNVCTKCHLRMGHTRNRCPMPSCESAAMCGQLEKHPTEKKELQELGKKKQKVEGELKSLKSELSIKEIVSNDMSRSFEAKIHDTLIRTNPNKYLTINNKPKEGIILADSFILKGYYHNKAPENIEHESEIWQTIIKSHEENFTCKVKKNSVIKELENRGINWPNSSTADSGVVPVPTPYYNTDAFGSGLLPAPANYNQMNWYSSPYYGLGYYQSAYVLPRGVSSPPLPGPVSSPPPPPPEDSEQDNDQ